MHARTRWLVMAVLALTAFGLSKVVPAKTGTTKAYVTNSLGDDITMIDLGTLKATGTIKVGKRVHGVCAQADGQKLFTTIESEKTLKVIDTATNEVTATIALTGRPNQCAATPDGHYVGVPIRDVGGIDIIDIRMGKVVKVLPVNAPHNIYNTGSNDSLTFPPWAIIRSTASTSRQWNTRTRFPWAAFRGRMPCRRMKKHCTSRSPIFTASRS